MQESSGISESDNMNWASLSFRDLVDLGKRNLTCTMLRNVVTAWGGQTQFLITLQKF